MPAMNQLDQLKQFTIVVADTGDFESIREFSPQDATTNPTLIYKAVAQPEYAGLLDQAIAERRAAKRAEMETAGEVLLVPREELIRDIIDDLLTVFGEKILKIVPGRVSTEVDARLSFDTPATIEKARKLIGLYAKRGVPRERILIKIASTWEGIRAAEVLQKEGINCNLTLLFSLPQAIACAEAGVRLISPFVGRIYDWYKAKSKQEYHGADDPGVQSVRTVYNYFKKFGYETQVMGASFRNTSQITELAGCDLLTISPELLAELKASDAPVTRKLSVEEAKASDAKKIPLDEKTFRWLLNEDAMGTEKLAEGIRKFSEDIVKLEGLVAAKLG